ncbi:CDP-diacylglycerol--glycerol-3-phosphate 3-phosphatidyltransferase [Malassezia pachydermatis]
MVSDNLQVPMFPASSSSVLRVETPRQFYGLLKNKVMQAKTRIFLSTLYMGKEERELALYLCRALSKNPALQLTLLMDAMRSTRESPKGPSSASLLSHLATMFPDQVDIRLYATPVLRPNGFKARMIGRRFNEGFGLQHMKIYGFDDDVIITGANLSRDYFTRRKDRYILIRNHAPLADYLHTLILLISRFSYALHYTGDMALLKQVKKSVFEMEDSSKEYVALCSSPFRLEWDGGTTLLLGEDTDGTVAPSSLFPPISTFPEKNWAPMAEKSIQKFTKRWLERCANLRHVYRRNWSPSQVDTYIVPLLQMGQLNIKQETNMIPFLTKFLASLRPNEPDSGSYVARPYTTVDLTSGYFTLSGVYKSLVLSDELHGSATDQTPTCFRLVAASPEANGFYGSKGVSSRIPAAYTYLEQEFWSQVVEKKLDKPLNVHGSNVIDESDPVSQGHIPSVELREWNKYGWTYHQKGMWCCVLTHCIGIWVTGPSATETELLPMMTMIGSSNYGARSEKFDLECSLMITTQAPALRKLFAAEVVDMRESARHLMDTKAFETPERKVSALNRALTSVLKYMF